MKHHIPITVSDLINMIRKEGVHSDAYCVFGASDPNDATLASICHLDVYPEITDDGREIYSSFVTDNDLDIWYTDELVQDVVENAIIQDARVSNEKILEAIKHYCDNDCFINL